ncbi:flagellar biosynthesis anti-sigma factor FlgM [Oceanobacter mangrovi]|uniref:flagellar biosynthesis anti-sigma factor FlgM n=1 Tax=Oceanobacter mangrovi TaxID=2862510 RepID=UPI001FE7AEB1|nr:flagellar biosynthesis anti-sigma factor FlgM [Oceanobacter mangrovi]
MQWFGDFNMNINKINGGVDNSRATSRNESATATPAAESESGKTESYSDQVKLSASGKSIQQIEAEISSMPEVNDATVERIRSAIENGEYKIDYDRLAGKMLDFEGGLN